VPRMAPTRRVSESDMRFPNVSFIAMVASVFVAIVRRSLGGGTAMDNRFVFRQYVNVFHMLHDRQ
jgi:hypothetical protein